MEVLLSAPDYLGNMCTTTNQNVPLSIFQSCTRPIAQALRVCDVAAEAGVVEAGIAGAGRQLSSLEEQPAITAPYDQQPKVGVHQTSYQWTRPCWIPLCSSW